MTLERPLAIAFGVSLMCHTGVVAGQVAMRGAWPAGRPLPPLRVVYEAPAAEAAARPQAPSLETREFELPSLEGAATGTVHIPAGPPGVPDGSGGGGDGSLPPPSFRGDLNAGWGSGSGAYGAGASIDLPGAGGPDPWAGAVDLTNLEGVQGNPVLLSYFSAIRDQIQRVANHYDWVPDSQAMSGLVYVGFVLERRGTVRSAAVLADRSVPSSLLQDAALNILWASQPFPPFPPSLSGESQTIVIPLEFQVTR